MTRRPSKFVMLGWLRHDLSSCENGIAVDMAAACFKYRAMFKTDDYYYGLDLSKEFLMEGLGNHPSGTGIVADLTKPLSLPPNSVDQVVSTNTLNNIPLDLQLTALKHLVALVKPVHGRLLINFNHIHPSTFQDLVDCLGEEFAQVRIRYYRNVLTRAYENLFIKIEGQDTDLRWYEKFATPCVIFLENVFQRFSALNTAVYIECTGKRGNADEVEPFSLEKLEHLDARLYRVSP
jgi:hypothetical protein